MRKSRIPALGRQADGITAEVPLTDRHIMSVPVDNNRVRIIRIDDAPVESPVLAPIGSTSAGSAPAHDGRGLAERVTNMPVDVTRQRVGR